MFFLHILILYHLLEEVIFTLYYLYTTTNRAFEPHYSDQKPSEIIDFRGLFLFFVYCGAEFAPINYPILVVLCRLVYIYS